jgi:large subunit ribosomal protein L13
MAKIQKTYSQKASEISRRWILIDASEAPIGRVATCIAKYLIGKSKVSYTPHIDDGDYVVVINAKNAVSTGSKERAKTYYRHSGFPGNLRETSLEDMRKKKPEYVIEHAVKGMLPKNKLTADRMSRLRVFSGAEHNHAAQKPEKVEVK